MGKSPVSGRLRQHNRAVPAAHFAICITYPNIHENHGEIRTRAASVQGHLLPQFAMYDFVPTVVALLSTVAITGISEATAVNPRLF